MTSSAMASILTLPSSVVSGSVPLTNSSNIVIKYTEDQGRGLYFQPPEISSSEKHDKRSKKARQKERRRAAQAGCIKAGSLLFESPDFVSVVGTEYLKTHCSHCLEGDRVITPCQTCRTVSYCSSQCQESDAAWHSIECGALTAWAAFMSSSKRQTGSQDAVNSCSTAAGVEDLVVPSATVRAAARIIWMKKVDPQRLVRGGMRFDDLHAIDPTKPHSPVWSKRFAQSSLQVGQYLCVAEGLCCSADGLLQLQKTLQAKYKIASFDDLDIVLSKVKSNAFCSPRQLFVSSIASLCNHSCIPNVAMTSKRTVEEAAASTRRLYAAYDLPAGTQLAVSYTDHYRPCPDRQEMLYTMYAFACQCAACCKMKNLYEAQMTGEDLLQLKDPSCEPAVDPRDALWCANETCVQFVLFGRCGNCRATNDSPSIIDVDLVHGLARRALEVNELLKSSTALQQWPQVVEKAAALLRWLAYTKWPVPTLLDLLSNLFYRLKVASTSILQRARFSRALIQVLCLQLKGLTIGEGFLYPKGDPHRVETLARLRRALEEDEQLPVSIDGTPLLADRPFAELVPPRGRERQELHRSVLAQYLEEENILRERQKVWYGEVSTSMHQDSRLIEATKRLEKASIAV